MASAAAQRMGVVDQVVLALHPRNRLATALGFVAGGVVPVATYLEAHHDLAPSEALFSQVTTYLVLGGLLFSAKTVFCWARRAFQDAWKAGGFVILLEGVMITSHVPVLPLVLLAILVAVNGVATGCTLSLERATPRPQRAARAVNNLVALSGGARPRSTTAGQLSSKSRPRISTAQGRLALEHSAGG